MMVSYKTEETLKVAFGQREKKNFAMWIVRLTEILECNYSLVMCNIAYFQNQAGRVAWIDS